MTSWGSDLWDSYSSVVEYVTTGTSNLVDVYAKYVKEKADLDKEYAKGLRKLIAKYEPKKIQDGEETTEISSFRAILKETGYQAGQYEIFAELATKVIVKEIQNEAAHIFRTIKENSKYEKKEQEKIDSSYMRLDKSNLKYQKSYHDWKDSASSFEKADAAGKISRNEIFRMKGVSEKKHAEYEACFALYCEQVDRTNREQREYFDCTKPGILCGLQDVEQERIEFVVKILRMYLKGERQMVNMNEKCRESIEEEIDSIDVKKDISIVVERYKSGDLPPTDIHLEEIEKGTHKKANSMTRIMMNANFCKKREKQNLFQKKRKIMKKIEKHRSEICKGMKEKQALEMMVQTYLKNPNFGDASKFQEELDLVMQKLKSFEEGLAALKRELDLVESKMSLNMRHSLLSSPSQSLVSMRTSSTNVSNFTCDSITIGDSDVFEFRGHREDALKCLNDINSDICSSSCSSDGNKSDQLVTDGYERLSGEWEDEFESETVIAIYDYDGAEEGTLSMSVGDQFEVLGTETDGWINVRRKGFVEEGFIPAEFIQSL